MTIEQLQAEYRRLSHAMQSGVAAWMNATWVEGQPETAPKHLRVGVNMAMVEHSALALLLIHKGIISEQEYWESIVERLQAEVKSYEDRLSESTGGKVTLA